MTASNIRKLFKKIGEEARLGFPVHPHQLWHALGYKLADDGIDTPLFSYTWATAISCTRRATRP